MSSLRWVGGNRRSRRHSARSTYEVAGRVEVLHARREPVGVAFDLLRRHRRPRRRVVGLIEHGERAVAHVAREWHLTAGGAGGAADRSETAGGAGGAADRSEVAVLLFPGRDVRWKRSMWWEARRFAPCVRLTSCQVFDARSQGGLGFGLLALERAASLSLLLAP